jgi:dTMP kinase
MLITLEGIDGSGKTTVASALARSLQDINPVFTREPGTNWVGDQVRRAIAEEIDPVAEALLFAADHAVHLATVIRPALDAGHLVISDRYTDSRYAYQSVTLKGRLQDPLAWLQALHAGWTVPPDLTFLFVLPVEEAMARKGEGRREHFEQEQTLSQVQQQYLAFAEAEPFRFVIVDSRLPLSAITLLVEGVIRDFSKVQRSRHRR